MRRIRMGLPRLNLRGKSLLHAAKFDELAAHIEAILSSSGSGDDLEWSGTLHFRVALRGDLKEFIGAEVEQDEFIAFEEAKAIGARLDSLAADLERDFSEEVCLIFLAEAGGVTGIVDHAGENVGVVGKMNAASVADLNRRRLAAEEDGFGEEFWLHVRSFEDNVFVVGRSGEGGATVPKQGSDEQQDRNSESRETRKHGVSLNFRRQMLERSVVRRKCSRHI